MSDSNTLQPTTFLSFDGKELHVHLSQVDDAKCNVIFIHGMADHSGRYDHVAHAFEAKRIGFYSYDQRGHGKSLGTTDTVGFVTEKNGWDVFRRDVVTFIDWVKQHTDAPVFLMGHSMGALVALNTAQHFELGIQGLVLSALPANQPLLSEIGHVVSGLHAGILGGKSKGRLQNFLTFSSYNKAFKPNRTDFDWISRDEAMVDAYVEDPKCGEVMTASFFRELAKGVKDVYGHLKADHWSTVCPMYLIAGGIDPVVEGEKGFTKTLTSFRPVADRIESKLYPGGRHEILNEINRDEVFSDILTWILKHRK